MYETLAVERDKHLSILTLNRPEARNALSRRMVDELRDFSWGLSERRGEALPLRWPRTCASRASRRA